MRLASLIRLYKAKLEQRALLPSQLKAMAAIESCRTSAAGMMLVGCSCGRKEWHCHSCGHRSCPRCQNHVATQWLERQRKKLLPVPYFLVTFTLPQVLRKTAWAHQRQIYDLLFAASCQSLTELAANPRFLGGKIGMTAVLHTHSRRLDYHPHLHLIVPGGALDRKRRLWYRSRKRYLVPLKALGILFREKFLAGLRQHSITYPRRLHHIDWVVDCQATGQGEKALQYLSRYLYRGILSERNILADNAGLVTFAYREGKTGSRQTRTLPGPDFIRLLLRHVLPKGYRRVREYGFLHGNAKKTLLLLQLIFQLKIRRRQSPPRPPFLCAQCGRPMSILIPMVRQPFLRITDPRNARGSPH